MQANKTLTTIYLLRHGAYENPRNILHLRLPGFPLSKQGKAQGQRLANILKDKPITAVYSSPLTRAIQTAKIIAMPHRLRVIRDKRLLDIRSPLQGKSIAYMESVKGNFYRPEFTSSGGERISEIYHRMHTFIKEKVRQHQGEHLVVVSHGDPIMSIKVKYTGTRLSLAAIRRNYVPQGAGYRITFNSQTAVVGFKAFPLPKK